MNLSRLFVIHALITLVAGIVLIARPALIPSTVSIDLQQRQYLLCYFLGAAEIAIAYLSFQSRKIADYNMLKLIVTTVVIFHLITALVEVYDVIRGGSAKLWANVGLRVVISLFFSFFLQKERK